MAIIGSRQYAILLLFWATRANTRGTCIGAGPRSVDDVSSNYFEAHHSNDVSLLGNPNLHSRGGRRLRGRRPRETESCPPQQYYDKVVGTCSRCEEIVVKCVEKFVQCPLECKDQVQVYIESKAEKGKPGTGITSEADKVENGTDASGQQVAPITGILIAIGVLVGLVLVMLCAVCVCCKTLAKRNCSAYNRQVLGPTSNQAPLDISMSKHCLIPISTNEVKGCHGQQIRPMTEDCTPIYRNPNKDSSVDVDVSKPLFNIDDQANCKTVPPLNSRPLSGPSFSGTGSWSGTYAPTMEDDQNLVSSPLDLGSMPESIALETEIDSGHDTTYEGSDSGNLTDDGYRLTVNERPKQRRNTIIMDVTASNQNPIHGMSSNSHNVPYEETEINSVCFSREEPCITQADISQNEESDDEEVSVKQLTYNRNPPTKHSSALVNSTHQKQLTPDYCDTMKMSIEASDCFYEKMTREKRDESLLKIFSSDIETKTGSLNLDLREYSDLGDDQGVQESGNVPTIPKDLMSGLHSARKVFFKVDWIEEYLRFEDKWEVNITPGYSVRQAKDILKDITGLSSDMLQVNTYESCGSSFERHGPGGATQDNKPSIMGIIQDDDDMDDDILIKHANPELTMSSQLMPLSQNADSDLKFDLHIGEKIFWNKHGRLFYVTAGSFVRVTTKEGDVSICAQTNCEGAEEGTPCYVARGEKYIQFGSVQYTYEPMCDKIISYDTMLIKIDTTRFKALPLVSVKRNHGDSSPHALTIAKDKMSNLHPGHPIKKVTSNDLDWSPDGEVRYPEISNKQGHYYGLTGITSFMEPPGSISVPGDCGTLITALPSSESMEVYGAVFGVDRRKDPNTGTRIKFTIVTPLKETFDMLKHKYNLQSIEFMRPDAPNEAINQQDILLKQSLEQENLVSVCNADGMTEYYNGNVVPGDTCPSLEQELNLDSGFQTMANTPNNE